LRGVAAAGVALSLLGICVAVTGWSMTPPVEDLRQRVATLLAQHGGAPMQALPHPDRVGEAVLATEDHRFYSHHGVDPIAVGRALAASAQGHDTGGATIDQQLAKMIYTPSQAGLMTELEQGVLALKIDSEYPKQTILLSYLNAAYFGHGAYGVGAAAHRYFGRSPSRLTWGQASLLAGLVQAPTAYDPLVHLDAARVRQQHVLDRLVAVGQLTPEQADAAFAAPLGLR
jgi:penicillin-binding protein 1A